MFLKRKNVRVKRRGVVEDDHGGSSAQTVQRPQANKTSFRLSFTDEQEEDSVNDKPVIRSRVPQEFSKEMDVDDSLEITSSRTSAYSSDVLEQLRKSSCRTRLIHNEEVRDEEEEDRGKVMTDEEMDRIRAKKERMMWLEKRSDLRDDSGGLVRDEEDDEDVDDFGNSEGGRIVFGEKKNEKRINYRDFVDGEEEMSEWEMNQLRSVGLGADVAALSEREMKRRVDDIEKKYETPSNESFEEVLILFDKSLKSMKDEYDYEKNRIVQIENTKKRYEEAIKEINGLMDRMSTQFIFFQEQRNYIETLSDCIIVKYPMIEKCVMKIHEIWRVHGEAMRKRMSLDLNDEIEDISASEGVPLLEYGEKYDESQEEKEYRVARRHLREHNGMNEKQSEWIAIENDIQIVMDAADTIFIDVDDEFCSVREIQKKFDEWKETDPTSFDNAYVRLMIPTALEPFVLYLFMKNWKFGPSTLKECVEMWDVEGEWMDILVRKVVVEYVRPYIGVLWNIESEEQCSLLLTLVNEISEYVKEGDEWNMLLGSLENAFKMAMDHFVMNPFSVNISSSDSRTSRFVWKRFELSQRILSNVTRFGVVMGEERVVTVCSHFIKEKILPHIVKTRDGGIVLQMVKEMVSRNILDTNVKAVLLNIVKQHIGTSPNQEESNILNILAQ